MPVPAAQQTDAGTQVRSLKARPSPTGLAGHSRLRVDWSVGSSRRERQLSYELQSAPTPTFEEEHRRRCVHRRYALPFGATATFDPTAADGVTFTIDGRDASDRSQWVPGEHEVTVPNAQITSPAVPSLR